MGFLICSIFDRSVFKSLRSKLCTAGRIEERTQHESLKGSGGCGAVLSASERIKAALDQFPEIMAAVGNL